MQGIVVSNEDARACELRKNLFRRQTGACMWEQQGNHGVILINTVKMVVLRSESTGKCSSSTLQFGKLLRMNCRQLGCIVHPIAQPVLQP